MVGQNIQDHPAASQYIWLTPNSTDLNLLNFSSVKHYLAEYRPDAIIHAAGRVGGIQANMREPVRFLLENLDMGRNLLLAAAEVGISQLVNFGSTCMYPKDRQGSLSESDMLTGPLEPTNEGYALAKITVARLAEYLNREIPALKYKTLIPCNIYGPHDKFDPRFSHMIPAVIHKLHQAKVAGHEVVDIWGTGEARREFLYAEDLADAVFKALANLEILPSMLNIGMGLDHTVNQYYDMVAKVVGYMGAFRHDLTRPTGMKRKLSNIDLATQWGWNPRHSLEDGLKKTYQYYLNHIYEG